MADPAVEESEVIKNLMLDFKVDNIAEIQRGCMQALLNMYERKITQEEVAANIQSFVFLFSQCAKLFLLNNIHDAFSQGGLAEGSFQHAYEGLKQMGGEWQQQSKQMCERMAQCPSSRDRIH